MYKIDNIYQKAKIKNLEQSLEFQKYNVKDKKKNKKIKKKTWSKNYRIYIRSLLKKKKNRVFFFFLQSIVIKVKIKGQQRT